MRLWNQARVFVPWDAFYRFNLKKIIPARTSEGNLDGHHHARAVGKFAAEIASCSSNEVKMLLKAGLLSQSGFEKDK